jgi:hypothetical protein
MFKGLVIKIPESGIEKALHEFIIKGFLKDRIVGEVIRGVF